MSQDENKEQLSEEEIVNQVYNYAAQLMVDGKPAYKIRTELEEKGLSKEVAAEIVLNLETQFNQAKNSQAKKDMIYGALWCVGGTVLTLAGIGLIFWGAILFGAIQFLKGAASMASD